MNLFSMIPDDFFKILTSKHKVLYLEVLFMLDDLMRGLIFVSREQVVETLQNYFLETGILPMNIEEEESVEVKTHRALAQSVLRELERKGWIRIIYENPNDEQISFPRYANRMIAVLKELEKSDHNAYARYVFTTYSSLKIGIEGGGNEWMALDAAWKATQDLQRVLQNTYFELNEIYNEILNDLSTNDILSRHFDVYQSKIIDQVLYPLKTNDSIPRFKQSILSLLDMYGEEALMERMINQQRKKDNGKEHDEGEVAARKIQDHLNELTDFYSDISGMLNLIDHKTQEYTTKSIGKIQYRLRSDFQLKGTIDTLIKYTKSADADSFAFLEWHDFGLVSQESLYTPRTVKPDIREKERLTVNRQEMTAVSDEAVVEKLRKMIHQKFSGQNVDKFVLEQLGGKDQISSEDIFLQDYDSFILTIMGAIRGMDITPIAITWYSGRNRFATVDLNCHYFILSGDKRMFEDLNFSEAYANYKEAEKLQFQQAAQRLLAVTYLNKNTGDLTRWDEDYLFIQKRQKDFTEFFSYLGMELTIHDSLQVISVESKFPAAKKKIDKGTTLYCLALRLVFDEKIKEFSGSDQVMIRNADFIGKLSEYGITDRKISLQEYARIMRSLVKIGILQKSKGPWDDLDTSFLIFPGITLLLPENKMKDFVKSLKTIEGEAVYD